MMPCELSLEIAPPYCAALLENVQLSIWKVIIDSHRHVSDVLDMENELRSDISPDRIFRLRVRVVRP